MLGLCTAAALPALDPKVPVLGGAEAAAVRVPVRACHAVQPADRTSAAPHGAMSKERHMGVSEFQRVTPFEIY
jgi:hypothetical protein